MILADTLPALTESLPQAFLQQYGLPDIQTTLRSLHAAESFEQINQAKRRLFFERMLRIQLLSLDNKQSYQEHGVETTSPPDRERIKDFISALPFELTHAQKRCIKEIIDDITSPKPMLRLLQGDVGSGKTIVAAIAALYTILVHHGQVAFLAPLEVLAQQHHRSLAKLLLPLGVRLELLTGSTTTAEKQRIKQGLQQGTVQFVV